MNFEEFKKNLLEELAPYFLGESPAYLSVKRTNAEEEALCIPSKAPRISRIFYAKELFSRYQSGEPIEKLAKWCADRLEEEPPLEAKDFTNIPLEEVKNQVKLVLRNKQWNKHLLKTCPHLDTGIGLVAFPVLEFPIGKSGTGHGISYLTEDFFARYKSTYTAEEWLIIAKRNTLAGGYKLLSIQEVLVKLLQQSCVPSKERERLERELLSGFFEVPLYVLTNPESREGSILFLYRHIMKQVMSDLEEEEGFYILPSSIEEVILIPKTKMKGKPISYLKEMVSEVNEKEVTVSERLSDEVYEYDGATKKIRRLVLS